MTLKELQNEVAALSFKQPAELDSLFINAANRALLIIFSDLKIKRTVKLFASPARIASQRIFHRHTGGTTDTLPLVGRAYSMRLYGEGKFTVRDGAESHTESFNADGDVFKGFLKKGGFITFEGDYSYIVSSLTTYYDVQSDDPRDIHDGSSYKTYDIAACGDFISACEPPKDGCGHIIEGADISGTSVRVSADYQGEINVTYYRAPKKIFADFPDATIDVPKKAEGALALLIAHFILLLDEPELASQYYSTYAKLMDTAKGDISGICRTSYDISNRWA